MPNAELARKILNAIDQNPNGFDMSDWFRRFDDSVTLRPTEPVTCNTTLCVAGWAAHLSGYTLINRMIQHGDDAPDAEIIASKDGVERDLPDVARELLDLGNDGLFYATEDEAREQLENIAASKS